MIGGRGRRPPSLVRRSTAAWRHSRGSGGAFALRALLLSLCGSAPRRHRLRSPRSLLPSLPIGAAPAVASAFSSAPPPPPRTRQAPPQRQAALGGKEATATHAADRRASPRRRASRGARRQVDRAATAGLGGEDSLNHDTRAPWLLGPTSRLPPRGKSDCSARRRRSTSPAATRAELYPASSRSRSHGRARW
jgi:hypothetical protein